MKQALPLPRQGGILRPALVVFAAWRPWRLLAGGYLFGAVTIGQLHAQALGIGLCLGQHEAQCPRSRAEQGCKPLTLPQALGAQAGVGQHHGHAQARRLVLHVRPHLGFHQHPHRRPVSP